MELATKIKSTLTTWLCAMVVMLSLGETRAGDFLAADQLESGQIAVTNQGNIGDFYDASQYDASGYAVAPKTTAFKNWNQFQSGTKGQFGSRADAGKAWASYKQANGITTGAVRSQAVKSQYLKGLAEGGKHPKWMNQWLQKGKVPPGHHVDHIKPLSVGGADASSNMRLLDIDMHKTHHRFYRPWE